MSVFKNRIAKSIAHYKIYILWIVSLLLFTFLIFHIINNLTKPTHGFAAYYTASRLFLSGEKISNFYNDDWFSSKVEDYVPGVYEIYLVNIPTTVFIVLPFSTFDYETARIIWITINFLLLIFTVVFIIRKLDFTSYWVPIVSITFLVFQPLYANFSYAQVYIFILFLLVLSWHAYNTDNQKLLGVLLGLLFLLKTAGVIIWLLLVIKKKWKSLIWILITMATLILITLPFIGIESWFAYSNRLLGYTSNSELAVTAYQTIHSFFHHLFMFDKYWNPYPVENIPILASTLTIFFSIAVMIITAFTAINFKSPDLEFSFLIVAGTILNPASIDYHFVLLLIPIIISIDVLRKNHSGNLWILLFISFSLIALKLPYTSLKITKGFTAIFAYPKLYGSLGMLIFFLLFYYRSKNERNKT